MNEDPDSLPPLEPAPVEVAEPEPVEETTKPHEAFRERQAAKRRTMSAAMAGGAWGALTAACALVLVSAWMFRVDVVSLWPRAASAYAAVGAEVNAYGYSVGELTITRDNERGIPLLVIEGSVKNFDRRAHDAPNLRAILRDDHGQSLLEWSVPVAGGRVGAGQRRDFRSIVSDPPPASVEVEVVLVGHSASGPSEDHVADASEHDASGHDEVPPQAHPDESAETHGETGDHH